MKSKPPRDAAAGPFRVTEFKSGRKQAGAVSSPQHGQVASSGASTALVAQALLWQMTQLVSDPGF